MGTTALEKEPCDVTAQRRKYLYRADLNLVDKEREARVERLVEALGESTKNAAIRRAIDEMARLKGVFDPPPKKCP